MHSLTTLVTKFTKNSLTENRNKSAFNRFPTAFLNIDIGYKIYRKWLGENENESAFNGFPIR